MPLARVTGLFIKNRATPMSHCEPGFLFRESGAAAKVENFFRVRSIFAGRYFCCLLLALGLVLQACGGVPETYYYTVAPLAFNAMKAKANDVESNRTIVLGVEKFSSEALYDDDRIIYRESPYEVKYYHYRRWATAPRQLVTEEVFKHLQAARICRDVVNFPGSKHVDYVLTGRILAFEEWDRGEEWFGRVAFTAQLYDPASRQALWNEVFEAETRAKKRIPTAVVEAIGKSLEKCLADLQQALPERVKK